MSRRQNPSVVDYGRFGMVDPSSWNEVISLSLTLQTPEDHFVRSGFHCVILGSVSNHNFTSEVVLYKFCNKNYGSSAPFTTTILQEFRIIIYKISQQLNKYS